MVPTGKARVARAGHHLSVITYAAMLYTALEAAEILSKEGIEIEILDLRTVSPLDRAAITATVKKTNKVIVLHEHARTGGLAGEISAIINEEAFDDLDGPIVRLTSPDTPFLFLRRLRSFFCPKCPIWCARLAGCGLTDFCALSPRGNLLSAAAWGLRKKSKGGRPAPKALGYFRSSLRDLNHFFHFSQR